MKEKDFLFPTSMPALYACKAAYYVGGDNLYWDVFDALQKALFTDNLNIENDEVIFNTIKSLECDFEKWQKLYQSHEVKDAVLADLKLVQEYGINSVPTLIINKTHKVNGVYNYEALKDIILDIQSKL